jgi:preprotein translocase subunit SecE
VLLKNGKHLVFYTGVAQLVEHRSPKPGVGSSSLSTRAKIKKMGIVTYIKESFKELNTKVTWMPLPEAQKSTVVVAIFTVLFALAIFLVDKVFQLGLEQYFNLF